jgi:hypothetical protein
VGCCPPFFVVYGMIFLCYILSFIECRVSTFLSGSTAYFLGFFSLLFIGCRASRLLARNVLFWAFFSLSPLFSVAEHSRGIGLF